VNGGDGGIGEHRPGASHGLLVMEVVRVDKDAGVELPGELAHLVAHIEDRLLRFVNRVRKLAMEAFQVQALVTLKAREKAGLGERGNIFSGTFAHVSCGYIGLTDRGKATLF
jgi:hypothetical protein